MAITTRAKVLQYLGLADDNVTTRPALVVSFLADGVNAQVGVSVVSGVITITPDVSAEQTFDTSQTAYNTLAKCKTAIAALAFCDCEYATNDGSEDAGLIEDSAVATLTTAGETVALDYSTQMPGTSAALIDQLILEVQAQAERFCGRGFDSAVHDDRLSAYADGKVVVPHAPIDTGETTTVSCYAGSTETSVASSDYTIHAEPGIIQLHANAIALTDWDEGDGPRDRRLPSPRFPARARAVRVQYTGGFETIPADLEGAATRCVATAFLDRRTNKTLTSDQLQGRTKQRNAGPMAWRDMIETEFAPWKRSIIA
jgi:hypothetical protein